MKKNLFIGIDLGWKEKKTSAICILEKKKDEVKIFRKWCKKCEDFYGRELFKKLKPYLENGKVIAIDSPLTKGRGKGKMRLFEKFFSRKVFKEAKINPVPPALMPKLCDFSLKVRRRLEKEGFVLDINLIETSSRLSEAFLESSNIPDNLSKKPCRSKNQKFAFFSALVAFFHSQFQTRYIGYKDGFLFLPKFSFWKKEWRKNFYQAWKERPRFKYRYLITNIFEK